MTDVERLEAFLLKMHRAAMLVVRFTTDMDLDAFRQDELKQSGVAMNLQRMGEAAVSIRKHFPDFVASHPEFPWQQMIGLRHFISHDYDDLDFQSVWNTSREDVPKLAQTLASWLESKA